MPTYRKYLYLIFLLFSHNLLMATDSLNTYDKPIHVHNLSGPRVGFTLLTGKSAILAKDNFGIEPIISQYGWQFERQYFSTPDGIAGITELVIFAGGLDQGILIPSMTWLSGVRTVEGSEIAFGPNISPSGLGMAFGFGSTRKFDSLHIPINVGIVKGKNSVRLSLFFGWIAPGLKIESLF